LLIHFNVESNEALLDRFETDLDWIERDLPRPGAGSLFNRILSYRTLPKTQLQLPILALALGAGPIPCVQAAASSSEAALTKIRAHVSYRQWIRMDLLWAGAERLRARAI
jgi:hypothetical protein